ncbi:MAG: carbohydrate transporter rane protein 1, family [Pseudonocardia sp.]|nr:carbohydrate transporter rane protein 1, family [Pseudonocardia sp.]
MQVIHEGFRQADESRGSPSGPGEAAVAAPSPAGLPARPRRNPFRGSTEGWLLTLPALAVLVAMTLVAGLYVFYISLYHVDNFGGGSTFVGLRNYTDAFRTYHLLGDLIRTIGFVVVAVLLELLIGGFLAFQLAKRFRGNGFVGILMLIPFAMTPAVSAMIFRILLDPSSGWVDHYMQSWGLTSQPIQWLSNAPMAWIGLIALDVWSWTPFVALILLAGIQSLPREVLEASAMDGASSWKQLRYITLPLLTPFIAIAGVLRTIQAFKTVDSFLVLTNGGPGESTTVANLSVYRLVVQNFDIGLGAAVAVVVLVVLLVLTPLLMRIVGRYAEHERGAS